LISIQLTGKIGPQKQGDGSFAYGDDVVYGLDQGRAGVTKQLLGDSNPQAYRFGMIQNDLTNSVRNNKSPTKIQR